MAFELTDTQVDKQVLDHEVGMFDDELDTLPQAFRSEQSWIDRGL